MSFYDESKSMTNFFDQFKDPFDFSFIEMFNNHEQNVRESEMACLLLAQPMSTPLCPIESIANSPLSPFQSIASLPLSPFQSVANSLLALRDSTSKSKTPRKRKLIFDDEKNHLLPCPPRDFIRYLVSMTPKKAFVFLGSFFFGIFACFLLEMISVHTQHTFFEFVRIASARR